MRIDPEWRLSANCRGMDTELFYQDVKVGGDARYEEARDACKDCPVKKICLEVCFTGDENEPPEKPSQRYGVRGGLSARQRNRLARQRKALLKEQHKAAPKLAKEPYCKNGHEKTKENQTKRKDGRTICKICHKEDRAKYAKEHSKAALKKKANG